MPVIPAELPRVEPRLCTSCGDCLRICPTQCLVMDGQIPVITTNQACIRCAACLQICPVDAVHWAVSKL